MTKITKWTLGFVLAVGMSALFGAHQARADCCGPILGELARLNVTAAQNAATNQSILGTNQGILTAVSPLNTTIIQATKQLGINIDKQTNDIGKFIDVAQQLERSRAIQAANAQALRETTVDIAACRETTSAGTGNGVRTARDEAKKVIEQSGANWNGGDGDSASSQGPAKAVDALVASHCEFASETDVKRGACEKAADPKNQMLDMRADLLTDEDMLDEKQAQAADVMMKSITSPIPPLKVKWVTTGKQKKAYASQLANIRYRNISTSVLSSILADNSGTVSSVGTDGDAAKWAYAKAVRIGDADLAKKIKDQNGVTKAAADKLMAYQWYYDPDWKKYVATESTQEQRSRDLLYIQSYQVVQNYEQIKWLKKIATVLASMNSMMAEAQISKQ